MNKQEGFVVSDKNGTLVQQYKWLWEQQRSEFVLLQQRYDALIAQLKAERADNVAGLHQLKMAQRERDVYAAALLKAHKAAAAWEQVFDSLKNANQ